MMKNFAAELKVNKGVGKRRFSLGRVMTKLSETSQTAIVITFLVMNLSTLLRQFFAFFCVYLRIITFFIILEFG